MVFPKAAEQLQKLYKLFHKLDCTQLEINPFAETPDGRGKKNYLFPEFQVVKMSSGFKKLLFS